MEFIHLYQLFRHFPSVFRFFISTAPFSNGLKRPTAVCRFPPTHRRRLIRVPASPRTRGEGTATGHQAFTMRSAMVRSPMLTHSTYTPEGAPSIGITTVSPSVTSASTTRSSAPDMS